MGLKVALGQAASVPGDLTTNLDRAARMVRAAAVSGARVLALPELFACGYAPESIAADPAAWSLRPPPPGTRPPPASPLAPLAGAAAAAEMWVLLGASVRSPDRPHNAVLIIDPDGKVRGHYAKNHLWGAERTAFDAGHGLVAVEQDGVFLGLGVCYDAGFPELSRAYARSGVHAVVFCSAFANGAGEHRYDTYHPARALENTVYTLVVNAVGRVAGENYFGRSGAWDPRGRPTATCGPADELRVVEISPDAVEHARRELPYHADLRTDLFTSGVIDVPRLSRN